MRVESKKFLRLLRFSALSTILASTAVFADDDAKTGTPTSTSAPKLDAPKPGLTERERWLLDKVEQLESRVAELESKSQIVASSTASGASPATKAPMAVPDLAATTASSLPAVKPPAEQTVGTGSKPEKSVPFALALYSAMLTSATSTRYCLSRFWACPESEPVPRSST